MYSEYLVHNDLIRSGALDTVATVDRTERTISPLFSAPRRQLPVPAGLYPNEYRPPLSGDKGKSRFTPSSGGSSFTPSSGGSTGNRRVPESPPFSPIHGGPNTPSRFFVEEGTSWEPSLPEKEEEEEAPVEATLPEEEEEIPEVVLGRTPASYHALVTNYGKSVAAEFGPEPPGYAEYLKRRAMEKGRENAAKKRESPFWQALKAKQADD